MTSSSDDLKAEIDQMIKKQDEKIQELIRIFAANIMMMKIKGKLNDKEVDEIMKDLDRVLNGV